MVPAKGKSKDKDQGTAGQDKFRFCLLVFFSHPPGGGGGGV